MQNGTLTEFSKKRFGSLQNLFKVSIHFLTDSMYYIIDTPRYHIDISNLRFIGISKTSIFLIEVSIYRTIDNLPPWVLAK